MEWALARAMDFVRAVLSLEGSLGGWGVEDSPIDNRHAAEGLAVRWDYYLRRWCLFDASRLNIIQ